jgi:hypothetical protein
VEVDEVHHLAVVAAEQAVPEVAEAPAEDHAERHEPARVVDLACPCGDQDGNQDAAEEEQAG